ncbi:unnamed protein product [Nesidiocoris tenuis]|uniref:Uncharacterized protein n=1 Tax=Nesidiocoris tenuis TaxID=355587 RepID=A0A6H5GSH9_9HEMI|nr:unnamed protein product [Nesidiocoris tenuis]
MFFVKLWQRRGIIPSPNISLCNSCPTCLVHITRNVLHNYGQRMQKCRTQGEGQGADALLPGWPASPDESFSRRLRSPGLVLALQPCRTGFGRRMANIVDVQTAWTAWGSTQPQCNGRASPWGNRLVDHGVPYSRCHSMTCRFPKARPKCHLDGYLLKTSRGATSPNVVKWTHLQFPSEGLAIRRHLSAFPSILSLNRLINH